MKKTLLVILVLLFLSNCFATSSPTVEKMISTNPAIPFTFAKNFDEEFAIFAIYDLFGLRVARQFQLFEVIDFDVQEDWGIIEFTFLQDFTNEDTIIALFENDINYVMLFLESENKICSIDFSLVPTGLNRMYLLSDYEPSN